MLASDLGVDPFQNHTFCESIKILQKKTFVLRTDEPLTYSLLVKKKRTMKANQWIGNSLLKGWSQGFLAIVRGVPNGASNTDVINVSYNYRRKYVVNKIEDSTVRSSEM